MADEPTKTVQETEPTKSGKVVFESQEDFNAVIEQRLARDRKKFSDYEELKKKAETLEAELDKRKTAELTDLEKIKTELAKTNSELENLKGKASKYDEILAQVTKEVETESQGLSEEQLKVVNYILDPHAKLSAIKQFKSLKPAPAIKKGGKDGEEFTAEEIQEMKKNGDPKWKEAWKKYRTVNKIQKDPFSF